MTDVITTDIIAGKILIIRGLKVMLDRDLADLYGVETKTLKQAVRRNIQRFPEDFMFEMTVAEFKNLRSQIVTSSWGGARYVPMVFTELGIAMLSSVLRSDQAIRVNIEIMRTFAKLRQLILDNEDIRREIEEIKHTSDQRFQIIFETLDQLLKPDEKREQKIGFLEEKQTKYGIK